MSSVIHCAPSLPSPKFDEDEFGGGQGGGRAMSFCCVEGDVGGEQVIGQEVVELIVSANRDTIHHPRSLFLSQW
jgi:hypothetical protein